MAAAKTANVTARIQPEIKEAAEAILDRLGIPVSVFIDMTYRQVIMHDGIPFSLEIPPNKATRDSATKNEIKRILAAESKRVKESISQKENEDLQGEVKI